MAAELEWTLQKRCSQVSQAPRRGLHLWMTDVGPKESLLLCCHYYGTTGAYPGFFLKGVGTENHAGTQGVGLKRRGWPTPPHPTQCCSCCKAVLLSCNLVHPSHIENLPCSYTISVFWAGGQMRSEHPDFWENICSPPPWQYYPSLPLRVVIRKTDEAFRCAAGASYSVILSMFTRKKALLSSVGVYSLSTTFRIVTLQNLPAFSRALELNIKMLD